MINKICMASYKLQSSKREVGSKAAAEVLASGYIPAEVYGHNQPNFHVKVDQKDFTKLFREIGETHLVELEIEGEGSFNVLIKDVQYHPVTDRIEHVDFYIVKMDEKLTTQVPLEFVGTAKAVKELGGVLVKTKSEVKISCLPADLISHIEVDLSKLNTFDDVIHIKDLPVPESVEILADPDEVVCSVVPPKVEKAKVATSSESEESAGESKPDESGSGDQDSKKE